MTTLDKDAPMEQEVESEWKALAAHAFERGWTPEQWRTEASLNPSFDPGRIRERYLELVRFSGE